MEEPNTKSEPVGKPTLFSGEEYFEVRLNNGEVVTWIYCERPDLATFFKEERRDVFFGYKNNRWVRTRRKALRDEWILRGRFESQMRTLTKNKNGRSFLVCTTVMMFPDYGDRWFETMIFVPGNFECLWVDRHHDRNAAEKGHAEAVVIVRSAVGSDIGKKHKEGFLVETNNCAQSLV